MMATIQEADNVLYIKRRKNVTAPETINIKYIDEKELIDLFWNANCLSFEDKQKLAAYLNTRGHNLKLFRGEVRGELHYTTEYFDGESWKKYKANYEEYEANKV
jgi:hypothetical protein